MAIIDEREWVAHTHGMETRCRAEMMRQAILVAYAENARIMGQLLHAAGKPVRLYKVQFRFSNGCYIEGDIAMSRLRIGQEVGVRIQPLTAPPEQGGKPTNFDGDPIWQSSNEKAVKCYPDPKDPLFCVIVAQPTGHKEIAQVVCLGDGDKTNDYRELSFSTVFEVFEPDATTGEIQVTAPKEYDGRFEPPAPPLPPPVIPAAGGDTPATEGGTIPPTE